MKHFLFYVEEAIKNNWDKPAISNYGANTFTFAEVAANVARMHILLNRCNIKKGDHVAIAARSSAEWCAAFIGITSYGAVAVPLLPDFLPENLVQLTKLSGSRMLFVDKNILAGFKRDNLLNSFDNVKDFIGIFDIVTYATVEGCDNGTKVLADELLDALYKS